MATAAISGYTGSVSGSAGTEIKKWQATPKATLLDATSMASAGWEEFIVGLQGCAGTFDCIGTPPVVSTSSITLTLKTATSGTTITGKALISDVAYNTPVEGVVTYTATFKFTGTVTVS
jgi:hypothetical protein